MSFLKELAKLSEPAPSLPDLEDENIEGNDISKASYSEETDEAPQRRRIIAQTFQDDPRYLGQKVRRCDIFDDGIIKSDDSFEDSDGFVDLEDDGEGSKQKGSEDAGRENGIDEEDISDEENIEDEEDVEDEDEESDDDEEVDDEDQTEVKTKLKNGYASSDEEDVDESEGAEDEEDVKDEEVDDAAESMKNIMLSVDKEKESKKAESVRQQLKHWEQLLFLKIKLQSAVRAYNQLPRGPLAKELLRNCDEETRNHVYQARKNAKELVELFLSTEKLLLASSPLTQAIVGVEGGTADSDDEEIESSEDEGGDDEVEDEEVNDNEEEDLDNAEGTSKETEKVGHSWKSHENRLKTSDSNFDKFRSATLVKWDERTKLTGPRRLKEAKKDFSAFEQDNIVQQIDKIMKDKVRILKRSQTKRSEHDRIGGDPEADIDTEIFDDDDFYQILLKEMIEKKTNSSNDPVAMTRHFIEMQDLRNKRSKKRVFDSKLSKDRKIKYVPIPKLVNFHPARPELVTWTHESRNELFKSLFK